MIKDAINQIAGIISMSPDIKEITIRSKNRITIFYGNQELQAETFTNSIDLLEWCEKNLKSPLDDITSKNIIASFFYRFKKNRKTIEF
jgi:hypothetical protein